MEPNAFCKPQEIFNQQYQKAFPEMVQKGSEFFPANPQEQTP